MVAKTSFALAPESTISDVEQAVQVGLEALRNAPLNDQITTALRFLVPPGYKPFAQLEEDGRKKRSTASASNWNPETGEIVIYFEPIRPPEDSSRGNRINEIESHPMPAGFTPHGVSEQMRTESLRSELSEVLPTQIEQCCLALADAEKDGLPFIALKRFRDNILMARGYDWTFSLGQRQAVVSKAIELGVILTSSIPNPRAPLHPTTTIKLNRESKYAQTVPPRLQPIKLRGEGLTASEIILRDRGRF